MNDLGFLLWIAIIMLWWIGVEVTRLRQHFAPTARELRKQERREKAALELRKET